MNGFNTQVGGGIYKIQFETDNERHYKYMQELARQCVDGEVVRAESAMTIDLNALRDAIYQDAEAHGLWEGTYNLETAVTSIGEEAIELVEAAIYAEENRGEDGGLINENWMHFVEELADVVISGFSVAGKLGIDIDAAIRRKMKINKGRAWKHEGEKK